MPDRYNTPARGASNWNEPVNENFRALETDVEIRDVESNRDNHDPVEGALFRATDTGAVYLGDGDAWIKADVDAEAVRADTITAESAVSAGSIVSEGPIDAEEVTFIGDRPSETTGLGYDEWSSSIDHYGTGTAGPRVRAELDGAIRITGATVDAAASGDTEVALKEINDDNTHGSTVDTSPISVTEGRNELEFDIVIPDTGEDYVLSVSDSNTIEFGAITSDDAGVPYPIEGDLLTVVKNSDPSGFVGPEDSYIRYFDITAESIDRPETTAAVGGDSTLTLEKVASQAHNNTQYAEPGELVETVESAPPESVIKMIPGYDYDPGEEIVLPNRITLDFNGARIAPTTDHNIFLLSEECTIKNGNIIVGYGYEFTSSVFLADTERYGDTYHGASRAIAIDAACSNVNDYHTGKCLFVNVPNESEWFSVQQDINLKIAGFGDGVHFHVANNSHANGNRLECHIWNCAVNIRQTGGGNCSTRITGEMDGTDSGPDNGTQYLLYRDNNSGRPITFYGYLWDSFNAEQEPIYGEFNIVAHNRPHPTLLPQSPNARGLIQWFDSEELGYADLTTQIAYRMRWSAGWWNWEVDTNGGREFSTMMSFRPREGQIRMNRELVTSDVWITGQLTNDLDFGGNEIQSPAEGLATDDPTTHSPAGYMQIRTQSGDARYVPYYE